MFRYFFRRLLASVPALLGICVVVFFLIHLIPGDAADLILGERANLSDKEKLRHDLGLDAPIQIQFANFIGEIFRGQLGHSLQTRRSVVQEISKSLPATFQLAAASMLLALLWAIPWGAWAGAHPGSICDRLSLLAGLLGVSLPGVFLGPLLVYLFALQLDLFPVSEIGTFRHLVLPALSLAIPLGAVILRMTRVSMLEVARDDYIRTARSKGLSEGVVYLKHALRNALMPVVTIVGLQVGAVLTGTVITETIFDWPGLGSLLITAIQRRDYPVVQGCVLFIAIIYVLVNLFTDLLYGAINPRVRFE